MKCPECGTAYREGSTSCHDCGVPLITDEEHRLKEEAAEAEREKFREMEIVEVYAVQGIAEAEIIQGMLESIGIESMTRGHSVLSVHPFTVDGMGEVRILVPEPDADTAREAIATFLEGEGEEEEE